MDRDFTALLEKIGCSDMLTTAYDTAWTARLMEFDGDLGLPAMAWLCENQLPDGSWGAGEIYYHDRVISTLSAMIALKKNGRRHSDKAAVEKGLLALEEITRNSDRKLGSTDKGLTVGFEVIVPTLVAEAESLGIIRQQKERILGRIAQQRSQKLSQLQGKMINRHVTTAFSAEMAGEDVQHMLDIENLQENNGSVGCSPSATAYFVTQVDRQNRKGMEYLYRIRRENGGAPNVAPFDVFEIAWTLWNLSLIPNYLDHEKTVRRHIDFLSHVWDKGNGAGFSSEYSVNDSDGTSVVFDVLSCYGISKGVNSILRFEEKKWFRCFALERDPSVSANIHVLNAMRNAGFEKDSPSIKKIIQFLHQSKNTNGIWGDKWHISPFYTTAHAVIACAGYADDLVEKAVDWLVATQKLDGSWGIFHSTAEETAYSIQALWCWRQKGGHVSKDVIRKGTEWLEGHPIQYVPLWIGKCLYCPCLVIDSAVLSAHTLGTSFL